MSNRATENAGASAHFLGGAGGAAAVGAYTIPGRDEAGDVRHHRSARGGRGPVRQHAKRPRPHHGAGGDRPDWHDHAVRSRRLAASSTGGAPNSTTWTVRVDVLDTAAEQLTSTGMGTLTLTETAPGRGSYETSGDNIFILDGLSGPPTGTRTGKYFVVGDFGGDHGRANPGDQERPSWFARAHQRRAHSPSTTARWSWS